MEPEENGAALTTCGLAWLTARGTDGSEQTSDIEQDGSREDLGLCFCLSLVARASGGGCRLSCRHLLWKRMNCARCAAFPCHA